MRTQVTNLAVADKSSLECLVQQALDGIYGQNLLHNLTPHNPRHNNKRYLLSYTLAFAKPEDTEKNILPMEIKRKR